AAAVVEQRDGRTAHDRAVAADHAVPHGQGVAVAGGRLRLLGLLHLHDRALAARARAAVDEPERARQGAVGGGLLGGPLVGGLAAAAAGRLRVGGGGFRGSRGGLVATGGALRSGRPRCRERGPGEPDDALRVPRAVGAGRGGLGRLL